MASIIKIAALVAVAAAALNFGVVGGLITGAIAFPLAFYIYGRSLSKARDRDLR